MARGGKREGAGRKPKADELKVIEQMDAVAAPRALWEKVWFKVEEGDIQAMKLWAQYRFGMPKQSIDANLRHSTVKPPIEWLEHPENEK